MRASIIVQFASELFRQHRTSDTTFQTVRPPPGDRGLVDLLMLINSYLSLLHTLSDLEVMPDTSAAL
jgi:hypothetical protein